MRTAIAVEKGITKIPWQLVCRVYRMSGFRMKHYGANVISKDKCRVRSPVEEEVELRFRVG